MAYSTPIFHKIKQSTGGSTGATTDAVDASTATFVVLAICYDSGATGVSVTDTSGKTWVARTEWDGTGAHTPWVRIYDCVSTFTASHTFSVACTAGFASIAAIGFTGNAASPADQQSGAFTTGGAALPGSVTPSEDNELLITAIGGSTGGVTYAVGSSFTLLDTTALVGGQAYGLATGYKIQTTAGAENPSWTGDTGDHIAAIITYKAAGGGGGGSNWGPMLAGQLNRIVRAG